MRLSAKAASGQIWGLGEADKTRGPPSGGHHQEAAAQRGLSKAVMTPAPGACARDGAGRSYRGAIRHSFNAAPPWPAAPIKALLDRLVTLMMRQSRLGANLTAFAFPSLLTPSGRRASICVGFDVPEAGAP